MAVKKAASKLKRKSSNGKSANQKTTNQSKKLPSFKDPISKSGMIKAITDITNVGRKDLVAVFDAITQIVEKSVKSGGPGVFVFPQLLKIKVVKKPARAARKGINPFTGEEVTFKAKPAYKTVKIKPLKKLKEMVA